MKPTFKILILTAFLAIAPLFIFAQTGSESEPPHPGDTDTKVGGGGPPAGAPIGSGTFILLTLAAAYAARKVYVMRAAEETA